MKQLNVVFQSNKTKIRTECIPIRKAPDQALKKRENKKASQKYKTGNQENISHELLPCFIIHFALHIFTLSNRAGSPFSASPISVCRYLLLTVFFK